MSTVSRATPPSTAPLAARPGDRFPAGPPAPLTLVDLGSVSGVEDRAATPSGALDAGPGAAHARTVRGARPPADDATGTDGHRFAARRRRPRRTAQTWPIRRRPSLLARLRGRLARALGRLLGPLLSLAPVALLLAVGAVLAVGVQPPARRSPGPVNLDDTSRCPADDGCATCGAVDDLAVGTADTPVGVLCLTLCGSCAEAGDLPTFPSWTAAVSTVIEHCDHLGVSLDEAAAARRAECPMCLSRNVLDLGRGDASCRACGHDFRPR